MRLWVEAERETDGRWSAAVRTLPGTLSYGWTRAEAKAEAERLARAFLGVGSDLPSLWTTGVETTRAARSGPLSPGPSGR